MKKTKDVKDFVDEYIEQLVGKTDKRTLKAYRCDLKHFAENMANKSYINVENVNAYIAGLYQTYKNISVKRKIASIRLFYKYLAQTDAVFEDVVSNINGCSDRFLPQYETATLDEVKKIFQKCNELYETADTDFKEFIYIRNMVILQMLFSTGITAEELCGCKPTQVNLKEKTITLINEKKERILSLENGFDIEILKLYMTKYKTEMDEGGYFILGRYNNKMDEQSIRRMLAGLAEKAGIHRKITPSMLRNAFIDISLEMGTNAKLLKDVLGLDSYHVITNHQDRLKRMEEKKIVYNNPLTLINDK